MSQNQAKVAAQFDSLSSTLHNVTYRLQTLEGALQAARQPRSQFLLRTLGLGMAAAMIGVVIGVAGFMVLRTTGIV